MTPLDIIAPMLTDRVMTLVRERLTTRKNFFRARKLEDGLSKEEVKLALVALHHVNPLESLSAEEEALLRGITSKTLADQRTVKA